MDSYSAVSGVIGVDGKISNLKASSTRGTHQFHAWNSLKRYDAVRRPVRARPPAAKRQAVKESGAICEGERGHKLFVVVMFLGLNVRGCCMVSLLEYSIV